MDVGRMALEARWRAWRQDRYGVVTGLARF